MKQKDKKITQLQKENLSNTYVQAGDFYDELQRDFTQKSKRTHTKIGISLKKNLELVTGRVVEVKSNYQNIIRISDQEIACTISGRLRQYLFKTNLLTAVGDWVEVDVTSKPDYRIEFLEPRKNVLSRYTEGKFQKEIIVASNIDFLVITASWLMPMLKLGLIDRYICIAALNNISPIICINKIDLCKDLAAVEDITSYYKNLDIPVVLTSVITMQGIEELTKLLADRDSVFSGQSGTGKSSLINALEPGIQLAVNKVSDYNDKGKHTTSQAQLIKWSFGGNLVDTPGLKTINLHRNQKHLIPSVFPGMNRFKDKCCFRDCTHIHESGCAVLDAVADNHIPQERYESYLRIMESL